MTIKLVPALIALSLLGACKKRIDESEFKPDPNCVYLRSPIESYNLLIICKKNNTAQICDTNKCIEFVLNASSEAP